MLCFCDAFLLMGAGDNSKMFLLLVSVMGLSFFGILPFGNSFSEKRVTSWWQGRREGPILFCAQILFFYELISQGSIPHRLR